MHAGYAQKWCHLQTPPVIYYIQQQYFQSLLANYFCMNVLIGMCDDRHIFKNVLFLIANVLLHLRFEDAIYIRLLHDYSESNHYLKD